MNYRSIGIVGLGMIGSSLARAVAAHHPSATLLGDDSDPDSQAFCLAESIVQGRIDRPVDLLFLAVPPQAMLHVLAQYETRLTPNSVVSDVASVKRGVFEGMAQRYPSPAWTFISSHPIAGSEHAGPRAGKADLFHGRKLYLTPYGSVSDDAVRNLGTFWESLGAHVEPAMDWHTHDALFAAISHLPHLLAFAAASALGKHETKVEPAKWARLWLRIAHSAPALWADIFWQNREFLTALTDECRILLGNARREEARDIRQRMIPSRLQTGTDENVPPIPLLGLAQCLAAAMLQTIRRFGNARRISLDDSGGAGLADITSVMLLPETLPTPTMMAALAEEISFAVSLLKKDMPESLLHWCREARNHADSLTNAENH
ncbi:MAG: prephenate dehydrogenase [Alphaproteobacteria bacterium]|nr:prephenate dehydrogenase [Alphaproteobacteria bacterium]